jgi:hypothetical protein
MHPINDFFDEQNPMSACSRCGVEFSCGVVDGPSAEACWCMALPAVAAENVLRDADGNLQRCLCPACLRVQLAPLPST